MNYAAIMVYVDTSNYVAARINLACDIAAICGARVIGISASVPTPPVTASLRFGAKAGETLSLQQDDAEADLRCSERLFRKIGGQRGCFLEWRCSINDPGHFVAHEARAADLILIGQTIGEFASHQVARPADLLSRTGRPILVVPPMIDTSPFGAGAVIAWKDTREARRALVDALPFLQKAGNVTVLEVASIDRREAAHLQTNDVAVFLSRHAIKSEAIVRSEDGRSVAKHILAVAKEKQAGLIVMGGRAHARLHDWTVGGDTYQMLKKTPICLFLSN
jgi:nucleotide-binding universal stress UspA family protein